MSDTDNREPAAAPQGEPIAASPITTDKPEGATAPAPATRIADSAFEARHADLPPLSAIGGNDTAAPAANTETASAPGPRRGRGRGAPAGKAANGQPAKVAFGVVENPADLTENLSGKHAAGYGDAAPAERPRREDRPRREERAPEAAEGDAGETSETAAPKEFVPPVSQGTFKAELNPEAEQKAREERRQREDRPRREERQGGEFRGERGPREDRGPRGERGPREDRGPRPEREFRGDRQQGDRPRRDDRPQGDRERRDNRGDRQRPGRLTIEAPKVPVQEPTGIFGKIKRWLASAIWGVPGTADIEFTNVRKPKTPHSKDWQFNRGEHRGDRHQGGNRGNGNRGGDRNPNRDGRHRPHARGGNHHDHRGGRQG